MEEGCGWLILILIVAGIGLAVIAFAITAVVYTFAFLGLAIIVLLDFLTSSFSWVGVSDPAVGWLLFGIFVGGVVGLGKGLKRAGRRSDGWKVYTGATIILLLILLLAFLAYPAASRPKDGKRVPVSLPKHFPTTCSLHVS